MKNTNIMQSAIDNWPEDEAAILSTYWADLHVDGESDIDLNRIVEQDIAHMNKVFDGEPDSEDLKRRFALALKHPLQGVLPL